MVVCRCEDDVTELIYNPACLVHNKPERLKTAHSVMEAERRMIAECLLGGRMFNMSGS